MAVQHSFLIKAHIPNLKPRTLTRDDLHEFWRIMESEGKSSILFYDGHVKNAWDYVDFMTSPDVYAYGVFHPSTGEALGTYFVNNFIGMAALIHFCIFNAGLPYSRKIGVEGTNFLLRDGGLSALIGVTPKPFRHAWKYALEVGLREVATLPKACLIAANGRRKARQADAVVTLCIPETLLPL